jgi:hypothetical protein
MRRSWAVNVQQSDEGETRNDERDYTDVKQNEGGDDQAEIGFVRAGVLDDHGDGAGDSDCK